MVSPTQIGTSYCRIVMNYIVNIELKRGSRIKCHGILKNNHELLKFIHMRYPLLNQNPFDELLCQQIGGTEKNLYELLQKVWYEILIPCK